MVRGAGAVTLGFFLKKGRLRVEALVSGILTTVETYNTSSFVDNDCC